MINKIGYDYIKGQLRRIQAGKKSIANGDDIEHLHKVRVASRKVLSAIFLFESSFKKNGFEIWKDMSLELAKSLGKARDLDVHIKFLDDFLTSHRQEEIIPGITRLKVRMTQKREKLNNSILLAIDEFSNIAKKFPLTRYFDSTQFPGENTKQLITSMIEKKLGRIKMYEPYIFNINNVEELHELRKANKLLRYALEIFNPFYENKLLPFIAEITNVQDKAGLIHDCDVWFELLPGFVEEEKIRTEKFYGDVSPFQQLVPGIQFLEEELQKSRKQMYYSFINEWKKLNARNFVSELLAVLAGSNEKIPDKKPAIIQQKDTSFLSM